MKVFITTCLCFLAFFATGQITTTKIATKPKDTNVLYDSAQNFLGEDVNKYLGQELYLNGKAQALRKYGYRDFCLDYRKDGMALSNTYKPERPTNKDYIRLDLGGGTSVYDSLVGKYFKVLDVIKHPKAETEDYLYGDKYYLKLQEKGSGDVVYFEYSSKYDFNFPFIVVGFFEKLKKQCVGQSYVFGSTDLRFGKDELDINTGKSVKYELGGKWTCADVTIEEVYYSLSLILKDKDGQAMAFGYEWVVGPKKFYDVFTAEEADKYKAKFGLDLWNTILKGKVVVGMTKEMCELAWDKPEDINETIMAGKKSEQWVYTDNYLYFDNGKLTAIQKH